MSDYVQVPCEAIEILLDHYLHCYGGIHDQLALDVRAVLAAAPQATDPREPSATSDLVNYGIHISKDGKRIAPEDFYADPRDAEIERLRDALVEVRTAAGVLYCTQVYQNRKREEGVSVDFVSALNYLVAVAGYREPLRHEYEPDQMAKINRARALTTQPSKTETRDDG